MDWLDTIREQFSQVLQIVYEYPPRESVLPKLLDEILSLAVIRTHGDPTRLVEVFPSQLLPVGPELFTWMNKRDVSSVITNPFAHSHLLQAVETYHKEICQAFAPQPA